MSQFLYYFTRDQQNAVFDCAADVPALGLEYAEYVRGVSEISATGTGPDGQGGLVVLFSRPGDGSMPVAFNKETQSWRKSANGKFWVGMVNDDRPGPEDLERKHVISGHAVKLRDGNPWIITPALALMGRSTLPRRLKLGDNGKWGTEVAREYLQLCHDAEEIFDLMSSGGRFRMPIERVGEIVTRALVVNYRVSANELDMLELFTETEALLIMEALVDAPTWTKLQQETESKNSQAVGSPRVAGPTAT